jgi:hypothetical protein
MELCGKLDTQAKFIPKENDPWHPLDKKLDEGQNCFIKYSLITEI